MLLDRKSRHARQGNCSFKGLVLRGAVLWIQDLWVGNSKKKKTEVLDVPNHEKTCARSFGGLLAQNEEPVKTVRKATALFFLSLRSGVWQTHYNVSEPSWKGVTLVWGRHGQATWSTFTTNGNREDEKDSRETEGTEWENWVPTGMWDVERN